MTSDGTTSRERRRVVFDGFDEHARFDGQQPQAEQFGANERMEHQPT